MALSIASLVVSVVSLSIGLVAISIAVRLSKRAEDSLRKSTRVAVLTTGRVLQAFQDAQRPDEFEIIKTGAPVWDMTQTPDLIKPGGAVELTVNEAVSGASPLDKDKVANLRLVVVSPSRRSFQAKGLKPSLLDDFYCEWRAWYPADFEGARSDEEGLYAVYCGVPSGNYKMLFSLFFVFQ